MARTSFLLDAGPAGADLSAANTGGSTPIVDTDCSAKFTAVSPYQGPFSARYSYKGTRTTGVFNRYTHPTPNPRFTSVAFRFSNIGTYAIMPFIFRSTSGALFNLRATYVSGEIEIALHASSSSATKIATLIDDALADTWYRVLIEITNYTTGAYTLTIYQGLSTTALATVSGTHAALAGISYSVVQAGQAATLPIDVAVDADYIVFDDTTTIGIPSNSLPTVSLTAPQNVAAGTTVNVAAAASDADGAITSYAWTVDYCSTTAPTLTGASTANVSLVAPAAGHIVVLKCVVTDNSGGTTTTYTEVRSIKSGAITVLPDDGGKGYTAIAGGFALLGTAANLSAALRDADAATGVQSPPVIATAVESRFRLEPGGARSTVDIVLGGVDKDDAGALTGTLRVYNGVTLIGTYPLGTITTSPVDKTISVSLAAISSDANNLWVGLVATS